MKQCVLTCSMGKRLIGKGLAAHPDVLAAAREHTLVVVAGTTNGYVAEELLTALDLGEGFTRKGFRRGLVVPPSFDAASVAAKLEGDVIIRRGRRIEGKTIFDVVEDLAEGDMILKGANLFDSLSGQAAVYIGHPQAGTIGAALPVVVGRRVRLVVPVGLEKRVTADVMDLAERLNVPGVEGPRLMPLPGSVYTELDAITQLTGAEAELIAAGGVYGAEGAVWVGLDGDAEQIDQAVQLVASVATEPPCEA
jgi:hypothetical protein